MLERLKRSALYSGSWNIAFRQKPAGSILEDTQTPFTVIRNSIRSWAADPFVVEHRGQTYVFAELYDYILRRGVLGYCTIRNGKASKWKSVIEEPFHLSYPCIMKQGDGIYMMPESGGGQELAVYEAVEFPDRWRKCRVLRQNVNLADTTPLPVPGKHLALTHCVDDHNHPKLMVIDLDGVREDVAIEDEQPFRSRPGGYPFSWKGELIRPSQLSLDCGEGYGKALIFNRCRIGEDLSFSETEIKELWAEELKLDKKLFLDGIHTYNATSQYEVVDIKTRRLNLLDLFMRFWDKLVHR